MSAPNIVPIAGRAAATRAKTIVDRLNVARENLLDLSLRNTLLNWRPLKTRGVEITDGNVNQIYQALVVDKTALRFLPGTEAGTSTADRIGEGDSNDDEWDHLVAPTNSSTPRKVRPQSGEVVVQTSLLDKNLQTRLLATWHTARTHIEERGFNILFLTLGMLEWFEDDSSEKPVYSPLLLVPVKLERSSASERFKLRFNEDDIEENLSLSARLKNDFGTKFPEFPELEDLDPEAYLDQIGKAVRGRKSWVVRSDKIALGFFSFGRLLMYRDLDPADWPEGIGPADHGILNSILGDGFRDQGARIEDQALVDDHLPPDKISQVMDADSSQLLAILEVRTGRSLVIQGPPGTGKSQTITNLIADALDGDKRVLFVAEKMAALEVVKRRLDNLHLGDACLELHSHTAHKKTVLAELKRTLDLGKPRLEAFEDQIRLFEKSRDQLNVYCASMNTPIGGSRYTPYQVIGELVRVHGRLGGCTLPRFAFPSHVGVDPSLADDECALPAAILNWSRADLTARLPLVENLQILLAAMGSPDFHPFNGSRLRAALPTDKQQVVVTITKALAAVQTLGKAIRALGAFMGLSIKLRRSEAEVLCAAARRALDAPHLNGVQLKTGEWQSRRDELTELFSSGMAFAAVHKALDDRLIPEAWDQDLLTSRQVLATVGRKWWRFLSGRFRHERGRVLGLCRRDPNRKDTDALLVLVEGILEAARHRKIIDKHAELAKRVFGVQWQGDRSNWVVLARLFEWVIDIYRDIGDGKLPQGIVDFLSGSPSLAGLEQLIDAAHSALPVHEQSLTRALTSLAYDPMVREAILRNGELPQHALMLGKMLERIDSMYQQIRFNCYADEGEQMGVGWLFAVARRWDKAGTHLVDLFRHAVFETLLRRAFAERPELARFDVANHESLAEQFRTLDRRLLAHNRLRLAAAHCERLPNLTGDGQAGVLLREFEKKTRHLPIRQLMRRGVNVIQRIKPIFMMSPMSVAAYLPPGSAKFDLVIFDEASQVRPVDAFGAILRGEQVVVVGDSKQMPPTSFFDAIASGDEDPEDEDENPAGDIESVLGLITAQGASQRMLRWHYRSRHESLIAVSNKEFYDNRLVVFPSPDGTRSDTGLQFRHLPDTTYDRGKSRTNSREAQAVAQAVMQHARTRQDKTLGVAAFSLVQADAIRDELELLRRQDLSCESFFSDHPHEPFFVKNLESVQGDERDVIFISVGYGRTAEGYVPMSFGPLNADGGERRLNVLITRARERCEVFTNLTHEDIDLSRTQKRGVVALKTFLKYAQIGILDVPTQGTEEADSVFEDEIATALERCGHKVAKQVGSAGFRIDLAVVDSDRPGRYLLGVECDGATYHSSRSARDRDRLRQQVLENLGWRIHRIWSTDWFHEPDKVLKKVLSAIEQARGNQAPAAKRATSPVPSHSPIERERPSAWISEAPSAQPYEIANVPIRLNGLELNAVPPERFGAWIAEVVKIEGPIHCDEAVRRIANAAGVQRIGNRIQGALEQAIRNATQKLTVVRRGEFLWPPNITTPRVRDRSDLPQSSKKLDFICDEEIAEAIHQVVRASFGIDIDAVSGATCRLLGFARVTDEMRISVNRLVAKLIKAGRLSNLDGQVTVPVQHQDSRPMIRRKESSMKAWCPQVPSLSQGNLLRVASVLVPASLKEMDKEQYLYLLADRVNAMAKANPNQLPQAVQDLSEEEWFPVRRLDPATAGEVMLLQEPMIRAELSGLEILQAAKGPVQENKAAREAYSQTDLEMWVGSLISLAGTSSRE
ncbi:MAG: DUF3320 domain-containing protein [Burkholderiales bacterium]